MGGLGEHRGTGTAENTDIQALFFRQAEIPGSKQDCSPLIGCLEWKTAAGKPLDIDEFNIQMGCYRTR